MDSVTQITLGATVGEAIGGRQLGARAPLWGAAFGTLPDLDVLADPFLTESQALTFHRSLSHSLVFVAVVTVVAAFGLRRLHRKTPFSTTQWLGLVGAVLVTHVGLDCLTTYGTQIFWPFSRRPVMLGTIFVIDPLYTIPLATGLLVSLRWPSTAPQRRWINAAGLIVSSAYLLLTIGNKLYVQSVFRRASTENQLSAQRLFTNPTPFNNLLWRGIVEAEDGFYVGFYSLLDNERSIDFRRVPKGHELLSNARGNRIVERFRRFSQGYFIVRKTGDGGRTIHDLRFGRNDVGLTSSGEYIFSFRLVEDPNGTIVALAPEQPPIHLSGPFLRRFVARITGRVESSSLSVLPMRATTR